jgi:hypothetical protein
MAARKVSLHILIAEQQDIFVETLLPPGNKMVPITLAVYLIMRPTPLGQGFQVGGSCFKHPAFKETVERNEGIARLLEGANIPTPFRYIVPTGMTFIETGGSYLFCV